MNYTKYYLIKDKPKFNKVRFNQFQGLTREIIDGNEFFYDGDGKVRMENLSKFQLLYVDYNKIWSKINTGIGYSDLLTNELCKGMVEEVFKIRPFPTTGWVKIEYKGWKRYSK